MKWTHLVSAALALVLPAAAAVAQDSGKPVTMKVVLSAEDAWEKGMGGQGLQKDVKGGLALFDTTLVEDDGPGSGAEVPYIDANERSPILHLGGGTIVKKLLMIEQPQALDARVYCQSNVEIEVNGKAVGGPPRGNIIHVPPELLKKGENVVILRPAGDGNTGMKISAREHILENNPELKDRPPRSFVSHDGGQTWTPIDGEVVVRLSLLQYPSEGFLISPVIDLAGPEAKLPPLGKANFQSAALTAQADTPAGTSVEFFVRTGDSPVYDAAGWTDWQPAKSAAAKPHRFLQWKAVLKTRDARATPVLKSVTCEAAAMIEPAPAWAGQMAVTGALNQQIRYTNMPFEYEDPKNPHSTALRKKYKLDEVIKDGNTEFEKLVLLRNWVKAQWKYKPPEGHYPAWDADEILTRKIGFCVQFAITYVECCAALGYPARFDFGYHPGGVAGSGHEVTEVWSNQYNKWVFMDPEGNRHYVDPNTKEPLGMLEAHDRMMKTYYGDAVATSSNRPKKGVYSDLIATVGGSTVYPTSLPSAGDPPPKSWPAWSKWFNVRCVPRNNFYSKPRPLPRIQGWGGWEWPGHWVWYDRQVGRDWRYRNFTNRRSDFEWTINEVCYSAEWGEKPGTLSVRMGTVTPNFDTFLVSTDGKSWKPAGKDYEWALATGRNRLEMRVRNTSGVEGPISFLEVEKK